MTRADAIQGERRRRNTDALSGKRNRMGVDMSKLDTKNFEHRWINDSGSRVHDLTVNDDWDIVPDRDGGIKADNAAMGAQTAITAGTGSNGAPVRAVLVRKPKQLYNDDKAALQRRIDEQEAGITSGAGEERYIPNGQKSALKIST